MAARFTKLGAAVQELRIHLCQTSPASEGARAFVTKHYKALKGANPTLPVLVRECAGVEPQLWARFAKGQEASASLAGLSEEAVAAKLEALVKGK